MIVIVIVTVFVIVVVRDVVQCTVGHGQVDLVAVLVDRGCVADQELERLSTRNIRAYRLERTAPFEFTSHLRDLLFATLGQLLHLGVEFFVGGGHRFLRDHRAQREIGEHRPCRADPDLVDERLRLLAGHLEVLLERRTLMRQPMREILDALARLRVDESRRSFDGNEIGGGLEHFVAEGHLRL